MFVLQFSTERPSTLSFFSPPPPPLLHILPPVGPLAPCFSLPLHQFSHHAFPPSYPTCIFILFVLYYLCIQCIISPAFIIISLFTLSQFPSLFSSLLHTEMGSMLWSELCPGLPSLCIFIVFSANVYSSPWVMEAVVFSEMSIHICQTLWHPCQKTAIFRKYFICRLYTIRMLLHSGNSIYDLVCYAVR